MKILNNNEFTYRINKNNQIEILSYIGEKDVNEIRIPATINDIPVTIIKNQAFKDLVNVTHIDIEPDNLRIIEDEAFMNCYKLEYINLNEGLISLGKGCFKNCHSLKSIDLPIHIEELKDELFLNCNALESINIEGKIKSIGTRCFSNLNYLYELTIKGNHLNISTLAFNECPHLVKLNIDGISILHSLVFNQLDSLKKLILNNNPDLKIFDKSKSGLFNHINEEQLCVEYYLSAFLQDEILEPYFSDKCLSIDIYFDVGIDLD